MTLGIDVGGTNVKLGVIDDELRVIKKLTLKTNAHLGIDAVISTILSGIEQLISEFPIDGIGLGTPGEIDFERGLLVSSANLPYDNTPIVRILTENFDIPVKICNDATCAVIGEAYAGYGRQYKDFVMLTLGTGIGGGIVIDGKPYVGKRGAAGELGHVTVKSDGELCRCGFRGCFESYASVSALIKMTENAARSNPDSLLAREIGKGDLDGKAVFTAASLGCKVAEDVIAEYIKNVALGIKNYQRIFDPEAIILAGAITAEGDRLLTPLIAECAIPCPIHISALGADTGIIGAAAMLSVK